MCISYRLQARYDDGKIIEIPLEIMFTNIEIVRIAVSMGLKLNRLVLKAETKNEL